MSPPCYNLDHGRVGIVGFVTDGAGEIALREMDGHKVFISVAFVRCMSMGRKTSPSVAEIETIKARMRDPAFRERARLSSSIEHINAKQWLLISPTRDVQVVRNLSIWCRANAEHLGGTWKVMLSNISERGHWRGWIGVRLNQAQAKIFGGDS